ncbi:hypothetical protein OO013_04415 [Mangrovivirga sp. M17]|uniref:Outer membrane protein beta-barrel domain-containing protein n=1 Tax=Mangrovivirga halotolerans TaxID=2993936 RepID=A0ABT3RP01_9BACT|nr:hypothetical protein [Mangrovivirga halotolerans]MCX2743094.1 hypothetical protein [Mangrovivirga halotolerans]
MRTVYFLCLLFISLSVHGNHNINYSQTDTTDYKSLSKKEKRKYRIDNYTGKVFWNISIPYINNFSVSYPDKRINDTGFMGISVGFDYYYKDNSFINLTGGGIVNYFVPAPIPVFAPVNYDQISSSYFSLSHNHKIKRHKLGYGVVYSMDNVKPEEEGYDDYMPRLTNKSLGLVGSYYYQLGRAFHLGFVYRPTFISLDQFESSYQHSISLDIAWKIRIIK